MADIIKYSGNPRAEAGDTRIDPRETGARTTHAPWDHAAQIVTAISMHTDQRTTTVALKYIKLIKIYLKFNQSTDIILH